jgi:hypothetical protein
MAEAEADGEEPAANVTRTRSLGETLRLMQESGAGSAQLTAKAPPEGCCQADGAPCRLRVTT